MDEVNEVKEETAEAKKLHAKPTSLIGQIVAALWVCGWSAYKFISNGVIEVDDIIKTGVSIVACFSPVYFNLLMDKVREIRFGK